MRHLIYYLPFVLFSGCFVGDHVTPTADISKLSYQLYLSRSSTQSTEFEQYKFTSSGLFFECGVIHRGRAEVREQNMLPLDDARIGATKEIVRKVVAEMTDGTPSTLDQPGTNAGFADPGKYLLSFSLDQHNSEIKTSIDAVNKARRVVDGDAKRFAELVRGSLPTPPCGNHDFYGIGMR